MINSNESAEIRYGCVFFPLKMTKKGTAANFFHGKGQNKEQLGTYVIANAKSRYG